MSLQERFNGFKGRLSIIKILSATNTEWLLRDELQFT